MLCDRRLCVALDGFTEVGWKEGGVSRKRGGAKDWRQDSYYSVDRGYSGEGCELLVN